MVNIINKIVKSQTAPAQTNVLWDDGENLKIYRNGVWENTSSTEIKEGSIPLSALDDKSNKHLKDWGLVDYVGKLGEGVLELPLNYYQCIIYNNTTKKIYQIMSGQRVTLQSVPAVIVKYNGSVVSLYDPDNVYSNHQIFVYKGIKTINDAYLPDIETPTPNWNTQEGKAGYIKNKPFGKFKVNGELFVVSTEPVLIRNVHYVIPQKPDIIDSYPSKKIDCIRVYWSEWGGEPVYIDEIINIPDSVTSMKTIKTVTDTPLGSFSLRFEKTDSEILVYLMSEDELFPMYAEDALNTISVEAVTYLPEEYLPDTVLKTTPQTLSDTDKNQARANLGISTPNWKAQEGKAGYIKNKPVDYANIQIIKTYDYSGKFDVSNYPNNATIIINRNKQGETKVTVEELYNTPSDSSIVIEAIDITYDVYYSDEEGMPIVVTGIPYEDWSLTIEVVQQIEDILPKVIKTTPQTLPYDDKNQALTNLGIADLLEALKPVRLSGPIPLGNVTQEQLDEIGLTEKVINNILNGYTNKICLYANTYCVIHTSKTDYALEVVFADFYFTNGRIDAVTQYRYHKYSDEITIEFEEI